MSFICITVSVFISHEGFTGMYSLCNSVKYYASSVGVAGILLLPFYTYPHINYFMSCFSPPVRPDYKIAFSVLWWIDLKKKIWHMRGWWHTLINMQSIIVFQFKFGFTDEGFSHCIFFFFFLCMCFICSHCHFLVPVVFVYFQCCWCLKCFKN